MIDNSKTRFSDRVENYIKYRPHYPKQIIEYLTSEGILKPDSLIADIGSGTGISCEHFLENGNIVYGVEPNKDMREAAERIFASHNNFISLNASAEQTRLDVESVDIVLAGQAFHWFDLAKCRIEFKRILKPPYNIVLMWNKRIMDKDEFQKDYESLLMRFGTDYNEVGHQNIGKEGIEDIFEGKYKIHNMPNSQQFDFDGLKGRLLSSSYVPGKNHAQYENMLNELKVIFDKYNKNGIINFGYVTEIYTGKLN